jgi:hypothetical protein
MKQLTADEKGFILWLITEYKKQHSTNNDVCNSITNKLYNSEPKNIEDIEMIVSQEDMDIIKKYLIK